MAKIIIEGPKEEVLKAQTALRETFNVVTDKVNVKTDEGQLSVMDVYATAFGKERFSDEEILKALECCSNKERDCLSCPYSKEKDCKKELLMDGAVYMQRLIEKITTKEQEN